MYNCKYCGKTFSTSRSCNGHQGGCIENPVNTQKFLCPHCNVEVVGKRVFNQHVRHCNLNPDRIEYKSSIKNIELIDEKCSFCGKPLLNRLSKASHERVCSYNPDREISNIEKHRASGNYIQWNDGLTKYTDERVLKGSKSLTSYYETHSGTFLGKHHSEKTKKLLSDQQLEIFHSDNNRHS